MSGNPDKGLMSKFAKAIRMDTWTNVFTGLGTSRDKVTATTWAAGIPLSDAQLESLYTQDDMASRICDLVPEEMLRQGFEISIDASEGDVDAEKVHSTEAEVLSACNDLECTTKYIEAMVWGRLFGGAAIFPGANDGADREGMAEPLNEKNIQSVDSLNVMDRQYLQVHEYYDDPTQPNFGLPKTYLVNPVTSSAATAAEQLIIHESRLIVFDGMRATIQRRQELAGWSDSILQRVNTVLMNFNVGWQAVSHLLTDASQGKFKIKGLIDQISAGNTETIRTRMALVDMNRSVARAIALDADSEDFTRDAYNFGNVDKVLQMFVLRLSAAARMPATILFGQSPAGMNATGESDLRWFYDTIRTAQTNVLQPKLKRLIELIMLSKSGPTNGQLPKDWSVTFPSLWQETPKEQAVTRKTVAETDEIHFNIGVLLAEEIALSRYTPTGYSMETTIDAELREALLEAATEKELDKLVEEPEPEPIVPPPVEPIAPVEPVPPSPPPEPPAEM